jgi:DNA-binding NarL/FixJ family response regulator
MPPADVEAAPERAAYGQADVFIVEDDPLLMAALSVQVEMLGYRVAGTASTAEDAVRGVLLARPQVVIMDYQLAGWGTGLDAARAIREALAVPIIFYTAHGHDSLAHEVATMGNAQLLQKPAQEPTLMAALLGVLG